MAGNRKKRINSEDSAQVLSVGSTEEREEHLQDEVRDDCYANSNGGEMKEDVSQYMKDAVQLPMQDSACPRCHSHRGHVPDDCQSGGRLDGGAPTILGKIVRLMNIVGAVSKDRANDFHHYKYLSAAGLLNKIQPALIELGLVARQAMYVYSENWIDTGKSRQHVVLVRCVLTIEDSETGDSMSVTSFGSGMDSGDKAVMKAQTAAHKYAWMHLLNIPTEDDPEADVRTDISTAIPVSSPTALPTGEILDMETDVYDVRKATSNPASPFLIDTPTGTYKTFNKDIATSAELAKGIGAKVKFQYKIEMYKGVGEKKIVDPKKEN